MLVTLLIKQRGYYEAVLEIAIEEHRRFKAERPLEEISPLIRKKAILVSCIEEIAPQITALKVESGSNLEAQAEVVNIEHVVDQIMQLDKETRQMLQERLLRLKELSIK